MQRISVCANLPQIILAEDGNKAGRKISSREHGWQCQGQSLKLYHRAEGDTMQVRKPSTSLAPPPQRRRRSSTNSTTGSQSSCSQSEENNSSDDGSSIKSDRKIRSNVSDGTTKTNDGKTTGVDKLPNIITGAEKRKIPTTRKNERKRKKPQGKNAANRSRQNQAAAVELKKENENEVKYGLDLTRNCRPGLGITRPYIFSYFPKIVNEKPIQNGGKDSTTSKTVA